MSRSTGRAMLRGFLECHRLAGALAGNLKLGNPVGKRAHGRGQGGRRGGRLAIRSSRFPKGHRRQRRRVTHGKCVGPCGHSHDGGARLPARSGPRWRLGGRARCPLRAGGDGRPQSRRPGAGTTENAALPRPAATGASAPRLEEAARAASGGRHRVDHPHSLLRDRRRRETGRRGVAARPPGQQWMTPSIACTARWGRDSLVTFAPSHTAVRRPKSPEVRAESPCAAKFARRASDVRFLAPELAAVVPAGTSETCDKRKTRSWPRIVDCSRTGFFGRTS